MNRTKLKTYARQARRDFIYAVTDRAAFYGLTERKIEPIAENGDVAIIAGRAYPRSIAAKRKTLEELVAQQGFAQTMEAMAYTWFNRFVAIRFMELHGYLDHGYRVLSHPESSKSIPEILEQAEHVELPELDKNKVVQLKLDGSRDAELYRMLIIAQCNALHASMPFLFERINDETELILPDNLLHSDSVIRKLVMEIDTQDWQEVEIIGWLYEFYISEKHDEVIGEVVKEDDLPAATQLFTPSWIVKYLVQNSLGRQWMATYPDSPIKKQMEYYIEPSEQISEAQGDLKTVTPDNLNPEELTFLDPACGSGHILVEAYKLLKLIYLERGYRAKEIPKLILGKNLFGLEIDDRAAQLAAFALMMKARTDNRSILSSGVQPQIVSIAGSAGLDAREIAEALNRPLSQEGDSTVDIPEADIASLVELFEHGKTFGALIRVPPRLQSQLSRISERTANVHNNGNLFERQAARSIEGLIKQAEMLCFDYRNVVTNPPYLHTKNMNPTLKSFGARYFAGSNTDLYEMFIARWLAITDKSQRLGIVCPFTWMFLSSFESIRELVLRKSYVQSLVQLEYNAFEPACVPVCVFVLATPPLENYRGEFIRLSDFPTPEQQPLRTKQAIDNPRCGWRFSASAADFRQVPGSVLAYWLTPDETRLFNSFPPLSGRADVRQGLITGSNDRFLRLWYEVSLDNSALAPLAVIPDDRKGKRWFPYQKGGPYRKWYGNHYFVVDWANEGYAIRNFADAGARLKSRPQNIKYFFRSGATWSSLTSGKFAFRFVPEGFIFDAKGPMCFLQNPAELNAAIALGNVPVTNRLLSALAPTLDYSQGPVGRIPWIVPNDQEISECVEQAVAIAKQDWDEFETSWGFVGSPIVRHNSPTGKLSEALDSWFKTCEKRRQELLRIEQRINTLLCSFCELNDPRDLNISLEDITLSRTENNQAIKQLLSYSIGCMMGRYSLSKPGLIYAHSGNQRFEQIYREAHAPASPTFVADNDGIIPLLDTDWGIRDDAINRIVEFIGTVWAKEHLEENLTFIADSLGGNNGEQSRETIRRYLATGFYKNHLQTYKGPKHPPRPIYWLFSSGSNRAFQCLVYLHRYHEGTLARMRTEYVFPLQGKMASRIEQLDNAIHKASSTSQRKELEKERDRLLKQRTELRAFDEKLRYYADQRMKLDLDDGVKGNYGKFRDLLANWEIIARNTNE